MNFSTHNISELQTRLEQVSNTLLKVDKENQDLRMMNKRLADIDKKYKESHTQNEIYQKEIDKLKDDLYVQEKAYNLNSSKKEDEYIQEIKKLNHENIITRALCNKPLMIQHDGLHASGIGRFNFSENIIEIIQGFDCRVHCIGMIASGWNSHNIQALLIKRLRVELNFISYNYDLRITTTIRI